MSEEQGSKITESLRIRSFDGLPSPQMFHSQIEPSNVPAVFRGAAKGWKAFSKWDPRSGGLDYLKEKIGSTVVEAMLSKSGPVFYGDLRSHERVPLLFSTFITSCKEYLCADLKHDPDDGHIAADMVTLDGHAEGSSVQDAAHLGQVYLAQVPIMNTEYDEMSILGTLQDDFDRPAVLESTKLVSINFWMNNSKSRSSTHYDPHHNLLCVIAGCKQVILWPPSASTLLYPMPVYGEASNHSAVDISEPDLSLHPRSKRSKDYLQKVILNAGDTLYLPEGWFHQVDSSDLTIAINFWWQSDMMSSMFEHMDSYYLRRIINRLVGREMDFMLQWSSENRPIDNDRLFIGTTDSDSSCTKPKETGMEGASTLGDLEPLALHALHELVSVVHETVNRGRNSALGNIDPQIVSEDEQESNSAANSNIIEEDPVASLLWSLKPFMLRKILLTLVNIFPRTLEALVLHVLSPLAAEILTRKFDEMDHLSSKDQRNEFYKEFYSVFQDQLAAMDSLLVRKESFAFQALTNVMDQYLDIKVVKQQSLEELPCAPAN